MNEWFEERQKNVCFTKLGSDDKWSAEVIKTGDCKSGEITINTYGVAISDGDCISWEISPHSLYMIRFLRVRWYDTICVLDENDVLIGSVKGTGIIHIPSRIKTIKYRIKFIPGAEMDWDWRRKCYYEAFNIKYYCLELQ
jgi:hypothetical protein